MSDNVPSNLAAVGFISFSKAYLELVDGLIERHISKERATDVAMELVGNYFNFTNNNKFAESAANVAFHPEEE